MLETSKVVSEREELSCPLTRPGGGGGVGLRPTVLYDRGGGGWKEREVFQFLLHTAKASICRGHVSPFIIMKGYLCKI